VDVRGVAQQEGAALAETLCDPIVNVIGREPVHLLDLDLQVIDCLAADILKPERIGVVGALIAYDTDQPCASNPGQREDGKQISLVEINV
jgi:hypothetical protein